MSNFIFDVFKQGLVTQIHEAEKNILVWQYVADEIEFLKTQPDSIQHLYSFIQIAAQTNFVLAVSKLYDNQKKFPTQSIDYFFKQLEQRVDEKVVIVETNSTKQLLVQYEAPEPLIIAIDADDHTHFPKEFIAYYRSKLQSPLFKDDIEKVKHVRDKVVAHNEAKEYIGLEFTVIHRLLKFATEVVSVFGMAYHSSIWETPRISLIKENAERNAWFIKSELQKLKDH